MNLRGGCWPQGYRFCERPCIFVRYTRNISAPPTWWRTTGQTVLTLVTHEVQDLLGHEDNPVRRVVVGGETLRRRVDLPDDKLDFPILHDLKAEGATDYFAFPVKSSLNTNYMVTYVTDRVGGFTDREVSDLTRVSQRFARLHRAF